MQVHDYEKALLGTMLRYPNGTKNIPQRVVSELDDTSFGTPAHRKIYQAIKNLVYQKQIPNTLNIATELKSELDNCGNIEYIESLTRVPEQFGVHEPQGFEKWVEVVDNAGRLRQLGQVIAEYSRMYEDFDRLVNSVEDVDQFLSNFMTQVNKGLGSVKTNYKHISEACDEVLRYLDEVKRGNVADVIPCGWPNLEKYLIPRPSSFGVIAGLSSMGKTQFALQIGYGVALFLKQSNSPGHVTINSLETPGKRLVLRLACMLQGVNSRELATAQLKPDKMKNVIETVESLKELPILYNDDPSVTSNQFVWHALAQNVSSKRVLGISDYVELFKDKGENEELRVSGVARNIRTVCWNTGSCELLISQYGNEVVKSSTKIGGFLKTRYSGAIGQAADWFIEIWNPVQMKKSNFDPMIPEGKSADYAYALIEKNKEYPVGEEAFEWIPEYTRFRDLSVPMTEIYQFEEQGEF